MSQEPPPPTASLGLEKGDAVSGCSPEKVLG